ncbi:MAG TPA: glycerophosphodiester phosphodiesterase family protein [Saprospiraceae bacterium]|nr:glycerophosphodiester phosphodiesterase family protein [Saprospiraceae bacterium]
MNPLYRPAITGFSGSLVYLAGIMLTILTFMACKTTETRPVKVPPGFDWQGHRGCRGLMPENSLPAFLKALEFAQVKTLELDLAVSKDGQLIVSHEPWFNPAICRKPNGDSITVAEAESILIYQLTAEEIKAYDCGSSGNPRFPAQLKQKTYKPGFREVVQAVRAVRPDIRWNIEIKSNPAWDGLRHPPVDQFVQLVVAEIRALQLEKQVTVQSFDPRAMNALHQQAPELQLAFLIENINSLDSNLARLNFTPAIYSPYYLLVDRALVKKCKEKNMKLVPWTVNDVKSMRRLVRLGVDGIITDYPDLIEKV